MRTKGVYIGVSLSATEHVKRLMAFLLQEAHVFRLFVRNAIWIGNKGNGHLSQGAVEGCAGCHLGELPDEHGGIA